MSPVTLVYLVQLEAATGRAWVQSLQLGDHGEALSINRGTNQEASPSTNVNGVVHCSQVVAGSRLEEESLFFHWPGAVDDEELLHVTAEEAGEHPEVQEP